jgi:hypothetical protein
LGALKLPIRAKMMVCGMKPMAQTVMNGKARTGMSFATFVKVRPIKPYPLIGLGVLCGIGSKLFSVHFQRVANLLR